MIRECGSPTWLVDLARLVGLAHRVGGSRDPPPESRTNGTEAPSERRSSTAGAMFFPLDRR